MTTRVPSAFIPRATRWLLDLLYAGIGYPREPKPPRITCYRYNDRLRVTICKSTCTLTVTAASEQERVRVACRYGVSLPRVYRVAVGANPDGADKQAVDERRTPEGAFRV